MNQDNELFTEESLKRYSSVQEGSIFGCIGNAVKKVLPDYETSQLTPKICKLLGEIISEGVLDSIIAEQGKLNETNQKKMMALREKQKEFEQAAEFAERKYLRFSREVKELENQISAYQKLLEEYHEQAENEIMSDSRISGAVKSYDVIYGRTHDEKLACKAFNSYLLGYGVSPTEEGIEPPERTHFEGDKTKRL